MMFCPKCGTKAIEGADFCQKCGFKLIKDQEPAPVSVTPIVDSAPVPSPPTSVEVPVVSTEEIPVRKQEADTPDTPTSSPASSTNIYTLLKENIGICPAVKEAKQHKKSVVLRSGICEYIVTIISNQARISNTLIFPLSLLYGLPVSLVAYIASRISWDFAEYGSFYWEDSYFILLALSLLFCGATIMIHTFCGRQKRADVAEYVREIVEPQGIALAPNAKKSGQSVKGLIAAIILIIAGVIILIFPLLENLDFGSSNDPLPVDSDDIVPTDSESVSLTQTYQDKEEGFSFMYPADWEATDDPDALVQLMSGNTFGIRAVFSINKSEYYDESTFYATKEEFQADIAASADDNLSNIEVTDLTDITLQGYPAQKAAWKCINTDGIHFITINYYYILDTDLYVVSCMVIEDSFSQYEPIFDAIMDSYTITAGNTTVTETEMVDQVLFCGIPIQEVIGMGYDEIISTFGEPNSVYDSNYSSYYEMNYGEAYASDNSDWMIFGLYFEEQNVITSIHASPGLFSFNGQNLRQDYNSLKSIFGEQLELGTTSMYNSESVLYYGDYVYTINYPISPDEWDENALPTDIYVQLFSQSVYNQNSDSGISFDDEMCYIMDGDENSQIVLYQDGTFSMDVNLYVGGGSLSGSYTCDDYGIHCFVETRNFQGYIGDDVTEFDLTFAEDYLVYRGESIGMTMDGVTFYPYSP